MGQKLKSNRRASSSALTSTADITHQGSEVRKVPIWTSRLRCPCCAGSAVPFTCLATPRLSASRGAWEFRMVPLGAGANLASLSAPGIRSGCRSSTRRRIAEVRQHRGVDQVAVDRIGHEQKSAHELVVSKRRRSHREQSRNNPDRPQHEDGYRPLPAVRGIAGSKKQWRKKTQDDYNKSCTEPNSSPPPSRAKEPWHRGKAERQNKRQVHQSVEHDLSD
jgi:hypothetical protein